MIELFATTNVIDSGKSLNEMTDIDKRAYTVSVTLIVIIYITLLIFAVMRALRCSSSNPDSRAIHLMFAFISPGLYVACSYFVPGFCSN
jgi:hypothetical protein